MKQNCRWLGVLVFLVAAPVWAAVTIPTDLPYGQDVEDWWSQHVFNPNSPNYDPDIISPAHEVTLNSGDSINVAIAGLPQSGGTIILNPGTYAPFRISKRKNVHIIAPNGATVTGYSEADGTDLSYHDFVVAIRVNHDPQHVDDFVNKKTSNIYIKGINFDAQNINVVSFQSDCAEGILVEDCTFQRHKRYDAHPEWGNHFGVTGGEMGTNNIWYRNCTFKPNGTTLPGNAIYCDGIHVGGMINCTIESGYTGGGLLYLVNDDYTYDIDGNGTLEQNEIRKTEYCVVYGCTFGADLDYATRMSCANSLIMNCTALGDFNYGFAFFNPKTSLIYPEDKYFYYGNKVIGNNVQGGTALVEANNDSDYEPPTQNNKGQIGRFTIKGNTTTSMSHLMLEIGQVNGPNIICGNCFNDPGCTPDSDCDGNDTTDPCAPGTPVLDEAAYDSVSFHWPAATDDIAVAGYLINRNGSLYDDTEDTSYTDEFCDYNTEYTYEVIAYDFGGNQSVPSNPLVVTTPFPPANADLDCDCKVNFYDFATLAGNWMLPGLIPGDLNYDEIVDYDDMDIMAEQWLQDNMMDLVQNGSFENDLTLWGGPHGGATGSVITAAFSYTGEKCFQANPSMVYGYCQQNFSSTTLNNLLPNTTYTLKAMLRLDGPAGGDGAQIRFVELNPAVRIYASNWVQADSAGQWVELTHTFTTSADYISGRLDFLWDQQSGVIYFDDVQLLICQTDCVQ